MNPDQFRTDLLEAIESGIWEDWTWDEDGNEYEIDRFNSSWALEQVIELLKKYGIEV